MMERDERRIYGNETGMGRGSRVARVVLLVVYLSIIYCSKPGSGRNKFR